MSWALEKTSFWRKRDLSRVLKHRYTLGKEASIYEEGSGGCGCRDDFVKGVAWDVGKGSSRPGPRRPVPDCVDARLLQRALFPRSL